MLSELASDDVDLVLVGGDVASGPLPVETVDVLRALPRARFVRGKRRPFTGHGIRWRSTFVVARPCGGLVRFAAVSRASRFPGVVLLWALLGPGVEFRRTDYDREAAAARIRGSSWPGAEEFARENVLSVASAEEAFEFFRAHGGP